MFTETTNFQGFAVDDLEAAERFYGEMLGLPTKVISAEAGLMSVTLAGPRDAFIYVKPGFVPATYTILNFEVDDIDAAVDELSARGVEPVRYEAFEQDQKGIARGGEGQGPSIAWFTDPAGNILSVLEQV